MDSLAILTLTRTPAYFDRLLSGLETQHYRPAYRGVVVNNASSPDIAASALAAGGWAAMDFRYNTTYSRGNNAAADVFPDTDWLLLLNDDLVLSDPDFLQNIWAARKSTTHDIVGAVLCHSFKETRRGALADGSVNHAGVDFLEVDTPQNKDGRVFGEHMGRGEPLEKWRADCLATVPAITFAVALIRRTCWQKLEGLDTRFIYGWEDTDFCLRAVRRGYSIGVARNAVAVHDECGTRAVNGKHEADNFKTFCATWGAEDLRRTLRSYAFRRPDVEGLAWR